MSFTYAQLKTAIQNYADYDESTFVTNLPVFIRQAEERILKNVQLSLFKKNVSGSFTGSNKYLTCPTDFLAPYSLSYTDADSEYQFLEFKDVDFNARGTCECEKASDELNDEDYYYFVI